MGIGSSGRHRDSRMRVDFRSKLGNQKLPFDRREAGIPSRRVAIIRSSAPVVDLARQSRFQMDDDGDLLEQILHIEAHIEELTDIIEGCRKIILISKVAIAAVIGGTVVFGSNTSTLKQTLTDMKAAEAHRTELISRMDLKVVGDGEVEN